MRNVLSMVLKSGLEGQMGTRVLSHLPRLAPITTHLVFRHCAINMGWRKHGYQTLYFDQQELGGKMQQMINPPTDLAD